MTSQCSVCKSLFTPEFAYQMAIVGSARRYFCKMECRQAGLGVEGFAKKRTRTIAVLNQKGGTGKTTTSINLAAGIAERGHEVLLVDTDAQGNVGASLGVRGERNLYHVLVEGADIPDVAVPVRGNLDVVTSDATLAAAEVWLARLERNRDKVLALRLNEVRRRYQYIIIDCGPSLSLLNQNALCASDEVIIPVSCDYLALVGVQQVLRTLKDIDRRLGHAVQITGVVPTFYESRIKLANEALDSLRGHFKERLYDPVRRSIKLAEAPVHRKTIFEYAADSNAADDYRKLVDRVCPDRAPARPPSPAVAATKPQEATP